METCRRAIARAWLAALCAGSAALPTYPLHVHADELAAADLAERQLVSEAGRFEIRWRTSPAPLPFNELFELHVDVRLDPEITDDGNPYWLRADAQMPEHAHGMNTRPRVEDLGDGRFVVRGMLFHMPGAWEIELDVAKGRVRDNATIAITLR